MASSSFFGGNPTPAELADLDAIVAQVNADAAEIAQDVVEVAQAVTDASGHAADAAASAGAAGASQAAAEAAATNVNTDRIAAQTARTGAETAKSGADTAKAGADSAKTAAEAARDLALAYRNTALTYRNDAEGFRNEAETFKNAAATFNPANFYTKIEADGLLVLKASLTGAAFTDRPTFAGQVPWDAANLPAHKLLPSGLIGFFLRNTAPLGWLKANGAVVDRTAYAELDAAIYCGDANNATASWGYRTNSTDTARSTSGTHIKLPDGRGEFLRGWDDSRGIDTGRSLWSSQAQDYQSHNHTASTNTVGDHTHGNGVGNIFGYITSGTAVGGFGVDSQATHQTQPAGSHAHTVTVNNSGGTETRPRNITALMCIKY